MGFTAGQPVARSVPGSAGRLQRPRGRKGAPSTRTVVQTFAGSAQPRALPAARREHFRKKEQIPNHKNFTAAKS